MGRSSLAAECESGKVRGYQNKAIKYDLLVFADCGLHPRLVYVRNRRAFFASDIMQYLTPNQRAISASWICDEPKLEIIPARDPKQCETNTKTKTRVVIPRTNRYARGS